MIELLFQDNFLQHGQAYKGGGGGGSSGAVDYPDYIKHAHEYMLTGVVHGQEGVGGITGEVDTALSDNPYDVGNNPDWASAYDPDSDLSDLIDAVNYSVTLTDIDTLVGDADTEWTALVPSSYSEDLAEEFEDKQYASYARAVNRFDALYAGANAVNTSAYLIGRALLENEHTRIVGEYRASREVELEQMRQNFILQYSDLAARLQAHYEDARREQKRMLSEAYRIQIVAKSEEQAENLEISVRDALWRVELYQHGANVLASHSGGTVSTGKSPNKLATAIGGAMMGMSLLGVGGGSGGLGFSGGGNGCAGGMCGVPSTTNKASGVGGAMIPANNNLDINGALAGNINLASMLSGAQNAGNVGGAWSAGANIMNAVVPGAGSILGAFGSLF